jgi:hypothetical protein
MDRNQIDLDDLGPVWFIPTDLLEDIRNIELGVHDGKSDRQLILKDRLD